jgi:hypothetical protein
MQAGRVSMPGVPKERAAEFRGPLCPRRCLPSAARKGAASPLSACTCHAENYNERMLPRRRHGSGLSRKFTGFLLERLKRLSKPFWRGR